MNYCFLGLEVKSLYMTVFSKSLFDDLRGFLLCMNLFEKESA